MTDARADDEMERLLGQALDDPTPDDLVRITEGLFAWKSIVADLADLEHEEQRVTSGVRSASTGELLKFEVDSGDDAGEFREIAPLIHVLHDSDRQTLVIDLGGSEAVSVELLRVDAEPRSLAIDAAGICRVSDVAPGPVQLLVTWTPGNRIKTRWVTL